MSLRDVKFTEEDMETVVEPLREVMVAFGDALFTTIHEAQKPSGKAKEGRNKVYTRWIRFGDLAAKFLKINDEPEVI